MAVFSSGGIGVDLGSGYTTVYLENEGVKLREPTYALVSSDNASEILAIGKDAQRLIGRTTQDSALVCPIIDGAVADTELAAMMLLSACEKAAERRKPFEKNRLAVTIPHFATRVERAALASSVSLAGSKKALVLKSSVAQAIGSGLRIDRPRGMLIISVGSCLTEISILSMYGVVASRTMKTGSLAFDEAIVRHIRREKGLVIGLSTAEDLKKDIGSAVKPEEDSEPVLLRGRNVLTGKPSTESITSSDIYRAMNQPIRTITEAICDALYNVPPELTGDILEDGICLTGGGALLDGFKERLKKETQLDVIMSAHPQDDAAIGAGRAASDERLSRHLINAGSAFEV